ncbi:hypothetical protein FSP39_010127 [Pinctada imbricata]|uniref:Uncharacterized protein n=1 Tax=Pinctada imbricata TaxID=66713 RepID=A0AA88YM74_PINIB|nr:hypothetical protein FSP39_010127 [Pinctada imbricata]
MKESEKVCEDVKGNVENHISDNVKLSNDGKNMNNDEDGDKNENCSTRSQKNSVTFSENLIDDTPRKTPDVKSAIGAFKMAECHSDSKLVTVPRKFQRRLARRSILKISSKGDEEKSPQVNKHFHPIKVGHIFSPCASPSASILKRRRLIGDSPTNSPSPPSKQRRVSFAEPLAEEQMLNKTADESKAQPIRPSSPLVINYTSNSSKTSLKFLSAKSKITDFTAESQDDSPMSPSMGSYQSTVEADLNTTDPICPELVECSQSVEKVLPQLTSSMWARGLGQLVRSRNIRTIGDLSSLTEREIQNLPIRSPKVTTVRKALKTFVGQKEKKSKTPIAESEQSKVAIVEVHSDLPESHTPPGTPRENRQRVETESDEMEVGPEMELDMSYCSPIKRSPDEELNTSIKDIEGTEDLLEEVNRFTCDLPDKRSLSEEVGLLTNQSTPKSLFGKSNLRLQVNQNSQKPVLNIANGASQKNSEDFISSAVGETEFVSLPGENLMGSPSKSSKGLVDSLQEVMNRCSGESLRQVKTEDLFELHRMSTTLTNQVMSALKTRCQPQDTQS